MTHPFILESQEAIHQAIQSKDPLRITASGTKDWYGAELKGHPLSTKGYHGIINYQPDELVITVRAGTSIKEVELAQKEAAEKNALMAEKEAIRQSALAKLAALGLTEDEIAVL